MTESSLLQVKVWGELACFTRPEMKSNASAIPL